LHRAVLGSLERFIGILIEQYSGAFPVWLAPLQVVVIPVSTTFNEQAAALVAEIKAAGFRVEVDLSDERMNNKIRKHQAQKVPYQLIIGGQEVENGTVSLRTRTGEQHNGMPKLDFLRLLQEKIQMKAEI